MPLGLEPLQEPSTTNFHCLLSSLILVGELARRPAVRATVFVGRGGMRASERRPLPI